MYRVEWNDVVLALVELTAFSLNLLTLYLISKLKLKDIDMQLGVIMAICDIIVSCFKLFELPVLIISGKNSFLAEPNIIIPTCGILLVVLTCSTSCVGYLSIVRWLVICRGQRSVRMRKSILVFTIHILILLVAMILCILNKGLVAVGRERYYYPDFHIDSTWGFTVRILIVLTLAGCFIAFNSCYILIAFKYLLALNNNYNCQTRAEKQSLLFEKLKIILKISVMLMLYNLAIVPFFIVNIIEVITASPRSVTADKISGSTLASITFVNPAMLITMHCETWREFRKLFSVDHKPAHFPIKDEAASQIDLNTLHV